MYTAPQNALIKADIAANPDLNSQPDNGTGNQAIADRYNLLFSPVFTVWKTNVTIGEIATCFNGTELAGLTANNHTRLATVAAWFADGMNPSKADMRQMLDDIFSGAGGTITRGNLATMYKRSALRIEKVLASGTGTTASPATLGAGDGEGPITADEVEYARRL